MKRNVFTLLISCVFIFPLWGQGGFTHEWKSTANSTDWNDGSNWDSGSVPDTSSNVKIVASNFVPTLSGNVTINHINIGGSINIGSHTLATRESVVSSFGVIVSSDGKIVSPLVGAFNNTGVQGNITLEFDAGKMNGNNTFENALTLKVNSLSDFLVAASSPDHFKGNTTFINNGTGGLYLAVDAGVTSPPTQFDQSFTFINNSASTNYFAENTTPAAVLFKGAVLLCYKTTAPTPTARCGYGKAPLSRV